MLEAIVVQLLVLYYVDVFLVGTAFSQLAQFFKCFFLSDCLKRFCLKLFGFLSPKLGTIDSFTIVKDNIH